jgi:hypothetical protein
VEGVETPPGSCPQGCGFASVALPHRNEIAIMRSAHFLWRSCHVQCDSTSEPTSGKQFARTLVRACVGAGRGSWKGSRHRLAAASGLWVRFGRPSHHRNEIRLMRSAHFLWRSTMFQCDSTSEPTSGKQFARTLVRACLGEGRGLWKGSRHRWQLPSGFWVRFGRPSHRPNEIPS